MHVVDDPRRGVAEQRRGECMRVGGVVERVDLACVRSAEKPVSVSPRFWPGLPITAVAVTSPSASKLTAVWLPFASVTRTGASTR